MRHRITASFRCVAVAVTLMLNATAMARGSAAELPAPDPDVYLDRSGFNELLLNQAVFGAQIGSALTTALFEDPARQASGAILGLGAGIALPIILTADRPVPSGDVVYINQLQRLGLINGLLLFGVLDVDGDQFRTSQALIAGGSLLGLGTALLTKDMLQLSPGQASALGAGYQFSLFTGSLLLSIFDVVESPRAEAAALLGFANTGLALAFIFRDNLDVNRSRIIWTGVGGAVGAAVGAGFGWLVGGAEGPTELVQASALAGFWAGAALTFVSLAAPDSFERRAELSTASLIEIGDDGNVAFGLPVPKPMLVPARVAGESPELTAGVTLLEWRAR